MDAVTERNTKKADSSTAFPSFDISKFEFPKMEIPEAFRDFAEKSATQAKDFFEKARNSTEEANNLLEKTFATAAKGTTGYNLKLIEIAKINSAATFSFVQTLFSVTDFSQLIKLSTDHAREQVASLTEQTKELTAIAQDTLAQVSEPLKSEAGKALNKSFRVQ